MTVLLALILGLLAGFYAQKVYNMVKDVWLDLKERNEAQNAGVVRPVGARVTKNTPIDLSTQAGSIMPMTPEQHALARMKERDERLKNL